MTNKEYCETLYYDDLWIICKVVERYISSHCGLSAPLPAKELALNEWYTLPYDPNEWQKASRKVDTNMTLYDDNRARRVGYISGTIMRAVSL